MRFFQVMDISLDKFYRRAFFHKIKIPEYFLAKLGLTVRHIISDHLQLKK